MQYFPRGPCSFHCRMILETKVWALGVPALGSQQTELGNPCVYTSLCTHMCLRFCICPARRGFIQRLLLSPITTCSFQPAPCWSLPPSPTARSLAPPILRAFAQLFNPVFMYSGFRIVSPWEATLLSRIQGSVQFLL